MNASALAVYCGSVLILWGKFVVAISLQARERLSTGTFRYPEDASCWQGTVRPDSDLCVRAQSLLRNDAEGQMYFLALGLAYVLVDAWPVGAFAYFPVYTLSRVAHGYFLLKGRQPVRTRVFVLGVLVLTALAVHVAVAAIHTVLEGRR